MRNRKDPKDNYAKCLEKILTFENLSELAFIWQNTPYQDFDNIFVRVEQNTTKKYGKIILCRFLNPETNEFKRIEALNYFRDPI